MKKYCLKFTLFKSSSKFEVDNVIVAQVHSYKAFKIETFNFDRGNSFLSKQQAFISIHKHHIKHNGIACHLFFCQSVLSNMIINPSQCQALSNSHQLNKRPRTTTPEQYHSRGTDVLLSPHVSCTYKTPIYINSPLFLR